MSLQVFLQAQILGSEDFLSTQHAATETSDDLVGRCAWLTLIGEVLPRALLSELKLSRMLLGSSSAEQFLLVLAEEDIAQVNEFLAKAAEAISQLSSHTLQLVWATTENLGSWPVVRKRLDDALENKISAPLANPQGSNLVGTFAAFEEDDKRRENSYFATFAKGVAGAKAVGWSSDNPAHLTWDEGTYRWPLTEQSSIDEDAILFPRRFAADEEGSKPGSLAEIASRADGTPRWGILRGDVDHFALQLRRAASVEDHIQFSALFKEFFAGELGILCTLPDFWRKVSILYRGGDDFAVSGSWDALVLFARELERLFAKFAEQHLSALPGVEAKTISMALAIAPELNAPPAEVMREAGTQLRNTKANELGSIHLFGRTLEWKRLADAEELKTSLVRLVREFRFTPDYINDLASVYREAFSARAGRRGKTQRMDKPWRTYLRVSRVIPQARGREQTSLRNAVITSLVGKKTAGFKLRPSARVGLEWARLAAGS